MILVFDRLVMESRFGRSRYSSALNGMNLEFGDCLYSGISDRHESLVPQQLLSSVDIHINLSCIGIVFLRRGKE